LPFVVDRDFSVKRAECSGERLGLEVVELGPVDGAGIKKALAWAM